ncbi:hypothetical protein [Microbacterium mcarthurae (nom. nud.)]|uniref:Uncharacterized protein n=1 Tax=Microbacterium mcarthurae TaxID=3035918 RepID=A0ABW9GG43_9MICO
MKPQRVQVIDLRWSLSDSEFREPAWRVRNRMRHLLAQLEAGDFVRLCVDRSSLPSDVIDLIPADVRVQIESDDATTLHRWLLELETSP